MEGDSEFLIKNESDSLDTKQDLNEILKHFYYLGGSDIFMLHGKRIMAKIHGNMHYITAGIMSSEKMETVANILYNSDNAKAQILDGNFIDDSYEMRGDNSERLRFRYNITGVEFRGRDAFQITIRRIPTDPLSIKDLGVEKEIYSNFKQAQGLVLVTGPTGSGKTTLMSANIRNILESTSDSWVCNSYESPVEFVYDNCEWNNNLITQTPVPHKVKSFSEGITASLRRDPDAIQIGELREIETINAAIDAALTGHAVYGTSHTNNPAETMRRLISIYPADEAKSKQYDLIMMTKMIVSQRLVRTVDNKKCAVKSWVIFTEDLRNELLSIDPDQVAKRLKEFIFDSKRSFYHDAMRRHKEGKISSDMISWVKNNYD